MLKPISDPSSSQSPLSCKLFFDPDLVLLRLMEFLCTVLVEFRTLLKFSAKTKPASLLASLSLKNDFQSNKCWYYVEDDGFRRFQLTLPPPSVQKMMNAAFLLDSNGKTKKIVPEASTSKKTASTRKRHQLGKKKIVKSRVVAAVKDSSPAYRSSLYKLYSLFGQYTFSSFEVDALKKLPFGNLIRVFVEKKAKDGQRFNKQNPTIKKLVDSYSGAKGGFEIGGKLIKLRKEELGLIFGIEGREKKVVVLNKTTRPNTGVASLIPIRADTQLRASMLVEALEKLKGKKAKETHETAENVAKLVCLILLSNVFLPQSSSTLKWDFLLIVEDLEKIKSYDWSGLIYDHWKSSSKRPQTKEARAMGLCMLPCTYLLNMEGGLGFLGSERGISRGS